MFKRLHLSKTLISFSTVAVFVLVFIGGFYLGRTQVAADERNLSTFWEVWSVLDSKFYGAQKPTDQKRISGAIAGMVSSFGDPYTQYFDKTQFSNFSDEIKGSFSGIGAELGVRDGQLTVISPIKGSPAENAGLQSGDLVVQIDSQKTETLTLDEAINLIRGERGTKIVLTIVRDGVLKPITIVRDIVNVPIIETKTIDNIYIVKLHSFDEQSVKKMYESLLTIRTTPYKGLILDLRGNPGGILNQAINIGSMFLEKDKVIVREKGEKNKKPFEEISKSEGYGLIDKKTPIVVLVDRGSASASEILAGALQDNQRATIIGSKTFGKGSVQQLMRLSDGSGIKVTVAKWYTPKGKSINENGLVPDITIEDKNREDAVDDVQAYAIHFLLEKDKPRH